MHGAINTVLELDQLGVKVDSLQESWLDTSGPVRSRLVAIFDRVEEVGSALAHQANQGRPGAVQGPGQATGTTASLANPAAGSRRAGGIWGVRVRGRLAQRGPPELPLPVPGTKPRPADLLFPPEMIGTCCIGFGPPQDDRF